jgi:hypothetical protein
MFPYLNYFVESIIIFTKNIIDIVNKFFTNYTASNYIEHLEENHRNEYNNLIVNVSYYCISFFSKLQLFGLKCKNKINAWLDANNVKTNTKINIIRYKDTNLHMKKYVGEENKYFEEEANNLYIFSNSMNEYTNYIISRYQKLPQHYEVSNIKFIMVELQIGDNKLKIDLKTDTENYYIVQNVFDKDFFKYYLFNNSHIYKDTVPYDELKTLVEQSVVKIIDENARIFDLFLSKNESIVILKDSYIINKNES